jgi:hypothetical protein
MEQRREEQGVAPDTRTSDDMANAIVAALYDGAYGLRVPERRVTRCSASAIAVSMTADVAVRAIIMTGNVTARGSTPLH